MTKQIEGELVKTFIKELIKSLDKKRKEKEKKKYVPITSAQDDWDDYHGRKHNA